MNKILLNNVIKEIKTSLDGLNDDTNELTEISRAFYTLGNEIIAEKIANIVRKINNTRYDIFSFVNCLVEEDNKQTP
jgi:hypothetical protein